MVPLALHRLPHPPRDADIGGVLKVMGCPVEVCRKVVCRVVGATLHQERVAWSGGLMRPSQKRTDPHVSFVVLTDEEFHFEESLCNIPAGLSDSANTKLHLVEISLSALDGSEKDSHHDFASVDPGYNRTKIKRFTHMVSTDSSVASLLMVICRDRPRPRSPAAKWSGGQRQRLGEGMWAPSRHRQHDEP